MSLNFNPLETNLVNLVIVISLLVWFLRGFLGGILERRVKLVIVRRPPTQMGQSNWGVVQLVRASVLYTGSRGFKSRRPNYALVAQLDRASAF